MPDFDFSFDDVLAEIERLSRLANDGFTVQEMTASTGHSDEWCRKKLKALILDGKVMFNGKVSRPGIDGRNFLVPAYRFIGDKDGQSQEISK